ncbi:hypothetical protein ILUMI_13193, partial [Ignelater luminosus]
MPSSSESESDQEPKKKKVAARKTGEDCRPQVDTCITCEQLSVKLKSTNLSDNVKRTVAVELMVHTRRAKTFYSKLSTIKDLGQNQKEVAAITFDLMQNLPLPNILVQDMFYLRQLCQNKFMNLGSGGHSTTKKCCLSEESYGKKLGKDQKHTFSPPTYMSFQYDSHKSGTVVIEDFIGGLKKHSFQLRKNKTTK